MAKGVLIQTIRNTSPDSVTVDEKNIVGGKVVIPRIVSSEAAPVDGVDIPLAIGDIFINTTSGKVYIATGVAAHTDYKILN